MIYFVQSTYMAVIQLVRCSFGIKSHPKQKCFDDSCISFCVGKQAADLSRFQIKSEIESRSFESTLLYRIFVVQIESQNVLNSGFIS